MFPHPDTVFTSVRLRHEDLLAAAVRERQVAAVPVHGLEWRSLVRYAAVLVAAYLGMRS